MQDVKNSLEGNNDVAIIEGPTGFGKSPVNIALGLYFKPTFYTTPQIKLVNQIARDFGPKELVIDGERGSIIPLLGRKNYICKRSQKPSDECPIYLKKGDIDSDTSMCIDDPKCTYWVQKREAQESEIAILTFAMLIINSYLSGDSHFDKRKLLIVDECHSLESQVASLFAGFTISPNTLPKSIRADLWEKIIEIPLPKSKRFDDYLPFFDKLIPLFNEFRPLCKNENEFDKLNNLYLKVNYMLLELEDDRVWIVNVMPKAFNFKGTPRQFKPIYVDRFLRQKVWHQSSKIILSSATIPFRSDPKKWLNRIGLGNKNYSFHSIPMGFPVKNRPIITSCMGGKMTYKEEPNNWETNIETIKEILRNNQGERGVIHTHSYLRAKKLYQSLSEFSIFLHDKDVINGDIIEEWIKSKENVLISPAIKEGVDLKDDLCRFQILLKVPYPSLGDSRVRYLLMEKKQWSWYFNETAKDILQIYGRAVRSPTDHAKLYIIDGSFTDIKKRNCFPNYFLDAIKI